MRNPTPIALTLLIASLCIVPPAAHAVTPPTDSSCTMVTNYTGPQTCQFACAAGQRISVSATPVGGATVAAGKATCGGATAQCSSSTRTPCSALSPTLAASTALGVCSNEGPLGYYADNQITCTAYYDGTQPAVPCGEVADGVTFCQTTGALIEEVVVEQYGLASGESYTVVGYLDAYVFNVADIVLVVPCVTIEGEAGANPCALAGGTFQSRVATLVDHTEMVASVVVTDSVTFGVCESELQFLVNGFGVESAPAVTLC